MRKNKNGISIFECGQKSCQKCFWYAMSWTRLFNTYSTEDANLLQDALYKGCEILEIKNDRQRN